MLENHLKEGFKESKLNLIITFTITELIPIETNWRTFLVTEPKSLLKQITEGTIWLTNIYHTHYQFTENPVRRSEHSCTHTHICVPFWGVIHICKPLKSPRITNQISKS